MVVGASGASDGVGRKTMLRENKLHRDSLVTEGMIISTSPNHGPRPPKCPISLLVLHYTGMVSAEVALARLCDPHSGVSAHYLVTEEGTVYSLVPEERRAWHAGHSCWRGIHDINSYSIGIEMVNPGHEWGYHSFPAVQIRAVSRLAQEIMQYYSIFPGDLVGHSDIAPMRKKDPGEFFPWQALAHANIGLWHNLSYTDRLRPDRSLALRFLRVIGYAVSSGVGLTRLERAVIRAFQRRYRPDCVDGALDGQTMARIVAMARLMAL